MIGKKCLCCHFLVCQISVYANILLLSLILQVYEIYISWLNATVPTPRYQLVGFGRDHIRKGQTVSRIVFITQHQMAVWIDGKGFVVEPGKLSQPIGAIYVLFIYKSTCNCQN